MKIEVTPWDGKPISRQGFYSGVPMRDYHSGRLCDAPSLSSSGHRAIFTKSEAHFYDRWPLNPEYDASNDEEESESLILGRATHHLLLGQPHFLREFVVCPEFTIDAKGNKVPWSMRTNHAKEWVEAQRSHGLTILTVNMMEKIKGMAFRLAREPLVAKAKVLDGMREITMVARCPTTGVWLLSRPDVIPTDSGDFTDVKTTRSTIYKDMSHAIGEYGYNQQAALCGECWQYITGTPMASFSFYFVESVRPYCARMVRLKEDNLALGMKQNLNARRRFVAAINTSIWPGPGGLQEQVINIDMSDAKIAAITGQLRDMEGRF